MLKIVEVFQQTGTDDQALIIVSCSIYSFLIWVYETTQTVFSKTWPDIWMLKIVEIFQHFPKIFTQLKIFLVPHQCFLLFYLAPKEFVFLNKTNSCKFLNWLKYYIKILTLILSAALVHRSGGVKNYFLYKTPIYLPIEDIKSFRQNGWSVWTWEPWLIVLLANTKLNTIKFLISKALTLREKCPNTELFLVCIFLYSDWIRRFTP